MWRLRFRLDMSGQSLVEVLVAIGISAIMLPALATALVAAREGRAQTSERLQATGLLREAEEAVRSVREKGWSNLSTNGTYRPTISGSTWSLTAGTETIGNFTRQVVVSDVQRDGNGAIVASGGTVDSSTKKVTITVSWTQPISSSLSSEAYFNRYQNNAAWTQTTQAEFAAGTHTSTTTTNSAGGEVVLTSTPGGVDWANASILSSFDINGTQDNEDVVVVGNYAYVADNTVLRVVDISNPAAPSDEGLYTAAGTIHRLQVVGNYAYLATTGNTAELTIVNISNPAAPTLTRAYDLTSNTDAWSIAVDGSYAYVGRLLTSGTTTHELFIVNISNPASPTVAGSLDVTGNVYGVRVSGNTAYLATSIDNQELKTVNITNKASPAVLGNFDMAGAADARDLELSGSNIYIVRVWDAANPEMYVVNVSAPASLSSVGSYEIGGVGSIYGISIVGNYAFLATDAWGRQFIVLNISTPSTPTVEDTIDLGGTAYGVHAYATNYAYLATAHDTREFIIVQPASSVWGYAASGTFESSTFDAGSTLLPAYNYLTFTTNKPASTNVRFQIATNNNGSTWNFVGPDGTASTFYDTAQMIRLNTTGRYFRYKATLTGPGTSTPTISDVSVNYAP